MPKHQGGADGPVRAEYDACVIYDSTELRAVVDPEMLLAGRNEYISIVLSRVCTVARLTKYRTVAGRT